MSMIGNTLLNEIINQKDVYDTREILELLDQGVHIALQQEEKANDDGMDVCLVKNASLPDGAFEITYTGAKRPLLFMEAGQNTLQEIKGDNRSIGGNKLKNRPFTANSFRVTGGAQLFLTSDGFADQASPEKKKFGSSHLKEVLERLAGQACHAQKSALLSMLSEHQGTAAQRDDISMLSCKL
jgi:serine phosphatase RsbU (regulator of sigma subunit)